MRELCFNIVFVWISYQGHLLAYSIIVWVNLQIIFYDLEFGGAH
jgi:hypothetical protein